MRESIDLNSDLGEDAGELSRDAALMEFITSANIACGGHAGDEKTIVAMVLAAKASEVAVGAHPSYPDRANFGRSEVEMASDELEASIAGQIALLGRIAREHGVELSHVKPHGALYHAASKDAAVARAVARAAESWKPGMVLVAQSGSAAAGWFRGLGCAVAEEAFADRLYEADGTLRARSKDGAVLRHPNGAAAQAVNIARGTVVAADGSAIPIDAGTICIHSDTPDAIAFARAVRGAIEQAGCRVARFSG